MSVDEPPAGEPAEDWMQVSVVAPPEAGDAVLRMLKDRFGYRAIDWCELERKEDYSTVTFAPVEPVTENRYTVDWRDVKAD